MPPAEEYEWFNTEVKPCEPALRAYLQKRFPVLSDHDDLVQEAYTRVVHAHRAGRLTSAKAFLFTVARNLAIDTFRRRRRTFTHETTSEVDDLVSHDVSSDPIASLEQRRRHEILIEAVASLPDRCREVMMLRHLDGMHYKDIATRLGISPNTVKVHIVKGLKDCTAYFRLHGLIDSDPPLPEDSAS